MSDAASPTSFLSRWSARAFAPVDIASLVWFRIAFGGIMLVEVIRYFSSGWIQRYFVAPHFLFKFYGFSWVQPWPGDGMKLHFFLLGMLAGCIALGLFYRLAAALFFLGFTYVFLLDQARYLNHLYLVCLFSFLLAVVPAHQAFSIDAWLRPKLRHGTAPAWALWLLRAQICLVFFFGGIAKLNSDWLHGEPMRMWLTYRKNYPVLGEWFTHDSAAYFFSYGGLLFDLGIVPLLLWRRTRWIAFAGAAVFNLFNGWVFTIGIFPWLALSAVALLFATQLPKPIKPLWTPAVSITEPSSSRLTLAFAGLYVALQILVPLRHWIYPGDVQWTEEGHRFSWRMKLRSKSVYLTLQARDPDTNETWRIPVDNYISHAQFSEAAARPDMILQLAHYAAADYRQKGHARVEVRAQARVSLNGRVPQPIIDPEVDLAAQPRTLGHAAWITSLATPLSARRQSTPKDAADQGDQADP